MSDSWRHSIVVIIYKNKDDSKKCTNYREIKLISYITKLQKIVVEKRFKSITSITKK